jgi:CRP/FNR family cyclic AMP-dependent transcriptional regulator
MISAEVLRRYPYFAGVGKESLNALATICEERRVNAGEALFHEGEPATHMFLVTQGEVDIAFELPGGEQRVVDTVVAGDLLAWSAFVEPHRYTATGVTRMNSKLVAIEAPKMRELCEEDPILGYRLLTQVARVLSRRLAGARVQLAAKD